MANTNYIQQVQVIVLLFIGPLWPLSTSDTRRRSLVWWSWFFRSAIAVGAAVIDNRDIQYFQNIIFFH